MRTSSLESKTIRPGTYSFYHSDRRPMSSVYRQQPISAPAKKKGRLIVAVLVVAVGLFAFSAYRNNISSASSSPTNNSNKVTKLMPASLVETLKKENKPAPASENNCEGNNLDKMVLVSISKRHAWACEKKKQVNDSAVITGMESIESTKTPVGTFHIYAKSKDTVLSGTDPTTGQWREPVGYWMPYHDNQYGTYGFHDAPWRQNTDFGNIDPNSMNGSHGCVQLPLNMAKWIFDWAEIGTTVIVKS